MSTHQEVMINELNERVKVRIAPSPIHGVGLFALRDMFAGAKLYANHMPVLYTLRHANFGKLYKEVREILLERWPTILIGSNFVYPDTRIQAYVNHSETPNYDAAKDVLLSDVKAGEEITEDYRLIPGTADLFPWLKKKPKAVV